MAIKQFEAVFDGAVLAVLAMVGGEGVDAVLLRQRFAQLQRKIGHLLKIGGRFLPQPLMHLSGTEGRKSHGFEMVG